MELVFPYAHNVQVHWQPASEVQINNATLRHWLLDTGSLTERLQEQCDALTVNRLGQGTAPLYANEQRWLPQHSAHSWQVREVLLCADATPWVFARSVLPQSLVDGELANLGNEPLGKRLFNDARFVRSDFELCQVPAQAFCFDGKASPKAYLWGRRSRFHLHNDYIIVAEIFLTASPAYQGN